MPGDGEYGKAMSSAIDYGAWWSYSFQRLSGLELVPGGPFSSEPVRSSPGDVRLTTFPDRRDWTIFADAYRDPSSGITVGDAPIEFPSATGPVSYTGHDAIRADIAHLKHALDANGYEEGFITSLSPGSASRIGNLHYATEEEFIWACSDAMREEYVAIIDAGLVLQIDDPSIAENWDQINPEPSVEDYLAFTRIRVEALNHALRGLPQERIRFHLVGARGTGRTRRTSSSGTWCGRCSRSTRARTRSRARTHGTSTSGACGRTWSCPTGSSSYRASWGTRPMWSSTRSSWPTGSSATRGSLCRERVIASTDCGLGGRIHPQIAWAKLESLAQGAEIATRRLWS